MSVEFKLYTIINIEEKKYKGRTDTIYTYVFKCINESCTNLCRVQKHHIQKSKGLCKVCVQRGKPFKAIYNELLKNAKRRNLDISLTFNDFLEFTKSNHCHYCNISIKWEPFTRDSNDRSIVSRKYQLDRKNNDLGYHKDNLVVCCTRCNYSKNSRYSYYEWYMMNEYFRKGSIK